MKTSLGIRLLALGIALLLSGVSASIACAEETLAGEKVVVDSSCFLTPAKLSESEINAFLADPAKLLRDEAAGGLRLSNQVRALAGSSGKAASALVGLVKSATDVQKAAIGAGLSRAVHACAGKPDYAAMIQRLAAELGDNVVITAFMAVSGDVEVAAIAATSRSVGGGTINELGQRSAPNDTTFGGNETVAQDSSAFDLGDAGASVTEIVSGVSQ